jgi:chromosome segregation ATPase
MADRSDRTTKAAHELAAVLQDVAEETNRLRSEQESMQKRVDELDKALWTVRNERDVSVLKLEELQNEHALAMQRVVADRDVAVRELAEIRSQASKLELERDQLRSEMEHTKVAFSRARNWIVEAETELQRRANVFGVLRATLEAELSARRESPAARGPYETGKIDGISWALKKLVSAMEI